jgi:cobalamin biosynthetic protein CobC
LAELHHGGRLREAAACYAIPLEEWLDLSTGINPYGWPLPPLSPACWQRLPESGDGLERTAAAYYGGESLLPVAGSQAAIQTLPQLRPPGRVGLLAPSYAEHAAAWQRHGHQVVALGPEAIEAQLPSLEVLLLVNPNNPTGECFTREQLLAWHGALAARGGWLVVDEAFIDASPAQSLAGETGQRGLVVLRSLGKFFGLAGARVGFVLAWPALLEKLNARLGPWAVSGPSREVARLALSDHGWQRETRQRLLRESARLRSLLQEYHLPTVGGSSLFQYCPTPEAERLHEALARQGILTRLFSEPDALRFGLPGSEAEWQRLAQALALITTPQTKKATEC